MQGRWAGVAVAALLACDEPLPPGNTVYFGGGWGAADGASRLPFEAQPSACQPSPCVGLFACMASQCPTPKPPPPDRTVPPPPPKLPKGADLACLKACRAKMSNLAVQLPALADKVVACAEDWCAAPSCQACQSAAACFEACLWQKCGDAIVQCGQGKAVGSQTCADVLACRARHAGDFASALRCLSCVNVQDSPLAAWTATCFERNGTELPACATAVELCACGGTLRAEPAPDAVGCKQRLAGCALAGPCSESVCLQTLKGPAHVAALALLECTHAKCSACTGAACDGCLATNCAAEVSACTAN